MNDFNAAELKESIEPAQDYGFASPSQERNTWVTENNFISSILKNLNIQTSSIHHNDMFLKYEVEHINIYTQLHIYAYENIQPWHFYNSNDSYTIIYTPSEVKTCVFK